MVERTVRLEDTAGVGWRLVVASDLAPTDQSVRDFNRSLGLALSLPAGEARDLILAATFAAVLFSVLVQRATLGRLIENSNGHEGWEWMTFDGMADKFRGGFPFAGDARPGVI